MDRLSARDRRKLVHILAAQPLLQNYRGRRQLLELAGLETVAPQIDLEGPPLVAVGEIVQVLDAYGRLAQGPTALGLLLNAVKETIGGGDPAVDLIDRLLTQYRFMTPVKTADFSTPWAGPQDFHDVREKIIGENTLRHVSFLERGLAVSRSVAFVDAGSWTGTAFLLSPFLAITNNHVLPSRQVAESAVFRFNYQLTVDGSPAAAQDYRAKAGGIFVTNEDLDFSLVELSEPAGQHWGVLRLAGRSATKGERVNIVQHAAGMPKQISIQNNFVEYTDDVVIQYVTATLGGSSGSPVFDDDWLVVAVHHAGGLIQEPRTGQTFFRNEGIQIAEIVKAVPAPVLASISGLQQ